MRRLSYKEFQLEQSAFEEAIAKTNYLAKFCSGIPWQCSAYEHLFGSEFGVPEPKDILIVEENNNWLLFSERRENIYFPFEAAWMFGCPLIGEPVATVKLLSDVCREYLGSGFGFVISGILTDSVLDREIRLLGSQARQFDEFKTTDCLVIDSSQGVEGFLARRSRSFRKGIRQMKELESLEFHDASLHPPEEVFARIFDVQSRSYKAEEGADIFSDIRYEGFYRSLYARLFEKDRMRTMFAQIDGKDIAYIMGGVTGNIYRGFQMSYDNNFRQYALGNRLQLENIQRMSEEGITHYDLGMHAPYKERWTDQWERYRGAFVVL